MSSKINVVIAVTRDAWYRLYEVATVCRALGFGHTSTISDIGVLKGSAEIEDLPALRAVPGVLAIEMDEAHAARDPRRAPQVHVRRGATLRIWPVPPKPTEH